MALSSDPYEQRLYQMFQAHDVGSCGGLDREALLMLCLTLELKERGHLLVKCLLGNGDKTRVTFKEFREGLLQILGGDEQDESSNHQTSPTNRTSPPVQPDSADGQNVSTGSPTIVSSSTSTSPNSSSSTTVTTTAAGSSSNSSSIISNTAKAHPQHAAHLSYRHHPHLSHGSRTAAVDSEVAEGPCESVAVTAQQQLISSSNIKVPSREDDLVTTTTTTNNSTINTTMITTTDNENESSDREVSPKFVVGTKKYGRRSRPREDINGFDTSSDFSNSDNESVPQSVATSQPAAAEQAEPPSAEDDANSKNSSKVQRSASQSDIHGSKRRRPPVGGSRLKRCASLPTHRQRPDLVASKLNARIVRDQLNMDEKIDKKIYFMKLSENLRDIWNALVGNGHGNLLNQAQLEVVCERVGLQKIPARLAAQEVFTKLSLQPIEGISFEEFILLLQNDSDILSIGGGSNGLEGGGVGDGGGSGVMLARKDVTTGVVRLFDESDNFKAQELDRDSVEETVGFTMRMPDWTAEFGSLSTAIIIDMWESAGIAEPKNLLHELNFYGDNVQVSELVAALEDEQLRLGDGSDTSVIVRASLALHKAEVSALRQAFVQLIEENKKLYADNKEVNHRAVMLAQEVDERHNSLEVSTRNKIRLMEQKHQETVKELTSQLAVEREQASCAKGIFEKRIHALEVSEAKVKDELSRLSEENECLRAEQENFTKELTELLEKNIKLNKDIAELEENNRNDYEDGYGPKNDLEVLELIEKVSILQDENTKLRDKNDELTVEIESLNAELAKFKLKRSSISRTSSLEVSPVVVEATGAGEENASAARKRQGDSPSKARLSDESPRLGKFRKCSNDLENESDSSGDWMALHSELGMRIESAITPSGIIQDCSTAEESSSKDEQELRLLKVKVAELEKKLEDKKISNEKTESQGEENTPDIETPDAAKLKARCEELESSMEQLSKEYEACEDYWQAKLNEERQLFEEEQRVSDDKFNELLKKMAEYEEQFAGQASNKSDEGRLSPIEEKDVLEQQYLDLEAEFQQVQLLLEERTHEVEKLRVRNMELEQLTKYPSEALLATPPRVDTPEIDSPASSPISYLWNQSTIQAPATRDYQNPNWCQSLKTSAVVCDVTRIKASDESDKLGASISPLPSKVVDDVVVHEDSGFNRTISPIQKPLNAASNTDVTSCEGDHQDMADSSDACSVKSARSSHSLASTHSIHKSVSQTDVAMITQEQLKQQRLMQLQLMDEIKDLTHQRDSLKMECQQLNEVKPILARPSSKTTHPNLTQKIHHLEQKNRQLQSMLKNQQGYTEQILHQIWQNQRSEIQELRNRLEAQSVVISDQAFQLAKNDMLAKDLYVENAHLVQRLEKQKARASLFQQFSQASASAAAAAAAHHHPSQLSGIVPGLP